MRLWVDKTLAHNIHFVCVLFRELHLPERAAHVLNTLPLVTGE